MTPHATSSANSPRRPRRAPAKVRQTRREAARAQQAAEAEAQGLTDKIMDHAAGAAAAAQTAAAITCGSLTPAELQAWMTDLEARLAAIQKCPEQNLGEIEEQVARSAREPLRLIAERAAQAKANATPCQCSHPQCRRLGLELTRQKFLRRTINSRFGPLNVFRAYGWCAQCEQWHFPADYALGLGRKSPASPYIQEISALLVSKMPSEQAEMVARRFGLDLSRCTLHREAHRQGLKAETLRAEANAQLDAWSDIQKLAAESAAGPSLQPFTLVIQIDAWNLRERDGWGQTAILRAKNEAPSRWHWVYMGTVFRLDHRGETAGQRAVISERGFVATRLGIEELTRQLHREAIRRGLGQAKQVLIIADGAVWIWNLAKDRFPEALQRLDLWHADENLWEVAHDLYGRGTPEARAWITPLLDQVRDDQTPAVIQTLRELQPTLLAAEQKKLETKIEYFQNNAHRMKYKAVLQAREAVEAGQATPEQIILANQPVGSGPIESTCRQYQCRFKRTGQFWTLPGDEALLALETLWRNGRWTDLYPHAKDPAALN